MLAAFAIIPTAGFAQTLYTFGDPTADEQYYIELINRARANPPAEGARLASNTDPDVVNAYTQYGVNLTMLQSEFNAIAAAQPLAPNGPLTVAARGHSAWMLATGTQAHDQPTNTSGSRITAAGYNHNGYGENIYAFVNTPWHGHAGFQVDWGPGGTGGMQPGRGHRVNIHNPNRREIGVGVTYGTNTGPSGKVGPQQVTQDFGTPATPTTFATGVAYYDLNGNNFYDANEGISGLTVNVNGASYYCKTAIGGGWVVPVPSAAATRTVSFSDLNISQDVGITFPSSNNAKADLKLAYTPPVISSPGTGNANTAYTFAFSPVGGATSYQWRRWTTATAPAQNAESTAGTTSSVLGGYSILSTTVKQQGASSFRLVNGNPTGTQWIELSSLYRGQSAAAMSFQSRLRYSTADEFYKVQVKEEGSATWVDVDSQVGHTSDEAAFKLRNVSLAGFNGKVFRVRFVLQFLTGSRYGNTGDMYGWFMDAIQFSNVQVLENEVSTSLAGTSGSFTPPSPASYLQGVYPVISGRPFPGSYQTLTVNAGLPPGFGSWASNIETANSLPAGTISNNPNGDHDRDGRENLLEYAFGTSPVTSVESTPRWPTVSATTPNLVMDYQVDTSLTDLKFSPEATTDMITWRSPGVSGAPAGFTDQLMSTNGTIQSRRATLPRSSGATGFIRVTVTRNP